MKVARLDEQLNALRAPPARPAAQVVLGPGDTIIVCSGFEERATEVLKRAVSSGSRAFNVLCIEYLPHTASNRSSEIAELCAKAGASRDSWTYDRENPAGAGSDLLRRVPSGRAHIDVSGMSRLLIVQLVSQAVRDRALDRVTIWYTEAAEYPPTRQDVEDWLADSTDALGVAMFLSTGVFGLTVVPELSSVSMQGQPIVLVAFPSWNTMQLAALRAELQTSCFVVVHGVPPGVENAWRPGAVARLNGTDALVPQEEIEASTLDYRETIRALLAVYGSHAQREKLVVAPTGSKMQAVGVGIVCGWLGDFQVVYPTARNFVPPNEYTRGVKAVYELDLAPFQLLLKRRRDVHDRGGSSPVGAWLSGLPGVTRGRVSMSRSDAVGEQPVPLQAEKVGTGDPAVAALRIDYLSADRVDRETTLPRSIGILSCRAERTAAHVEAEIVRASAELVLDVSKTWVPGLKSIGAEDADWDWPAKSSDTQYVGDVDHVMVVHGGRVQAILLTSNPADAPDMCELDGVPLYIEYLAVAPWNRPEWVEGQEYRAIGPVLLRYAAYRSVRIGREGRLALHSLPKANKFYGDIKLNARGADLSHELRLNYFEGGADWARTFVQPRLAKKE